MRNLAFRFLLFLCAQSACFAAEVTRPETRFTAICKTTQSVGFAFKDNRWEKVELDPSTYVISKIDPEAHAKECDVFNVKHHSEWSVLPEIKSDKQEAVGAGCYRVKHLNARTQFQWALDCTEEWRVRNGGWRLRHVACNEAPQPLSFDIDGAFAMTSILPVFDYTGVPGFENIPEHGGSVFLQIGDCALTD
jgi:hypothetical protein